MAQRPSFVRFDVVSSVASAQVSRRHAVWMIQAARRGARAALAVPQRRITQTARVALLAPPEGGREQAKLPGAPDRLRATVGVELDVDVAQVCPDCVCRDAQLSGDLRRPQVAWQVSDNAELRLAEFLQQRGGLAADLWRGTGEHVGDRLPQRGMRGAVRRNPGTLTVPPRASRQGARCPRCRRREQLGGLNRAARAAGHRRLWRRTRCGGRTSGRCSRPGRHCIM
jgi:hypothetical protein